MRETVLTSVESQIYGTVSFSSFLLNNTFVWSLQSETSQFFFISFGNLIHTDGPIKERDPVEDVRRILSFLRSRVLV